MVADPDFTVICDASALLPSLTAITPESLLIFAAIASVVPNAFN